VNAAPLISCYLNRRIRSSWQSTSFDHGTSFTSATEGPARQIGDELAEERPSWFC
jgi:hypothetical protein